MNIDSFKLYYNSYIIVSLKCINYVPQRVDAVYNSGQNEKVCLQTQNCYSLDHHVNPLAI